MRFKWAGRETFTFKISHKQNCGLNGVQFIDRDLPFGNDTGNEDDVPINNHF